MAEALRRARLRGGRGERYRELAELRGECKRQKAK